MNYPNNTHHLTISLGLIALFALQSIAPTSVQAQVIPDATLPNPSIVTELDRQTRRIDGGTIAGSNLFHSFAQFNQSGELSGSTIRFEPDAAIANIFARVTGGSGTTIDGLLQTTGSANLYLIDPQGIQFGSKARLDLGGAFIATSADRVAFADGTGWPGRGESTPQSSLLTISTPVGLQFDTPMIADRDHATTGAITIRGPGHQQRFFSADSPESLAILDALVTDDPSIDRDLLLRLGATIDIVSDTAGITASNTTPIALVGRNLNLTGGQIDTQGGAIDLVAIASGQVAIDTTRHTQLGEIYTTSDAITLGDIRLSEAATLNTSGVGSGTVRLRGHDLMFDDGSVIFRVHWAAIREDALA
ncbi:MAG: filamentous hemagglutinin N-terminal domain-containing protein [Coleofasciculaceae cyanobacterium RL_1_1]|nr:filamentous hemagglutinin N-terminal domain-containing protein [Coleofasciculaceae cyanobacterium RL_1_1]